VRDVNKIKSLGKLLLKLETRSKSGSGMKFIFIMFTYLIPGVFLPLLIVRQNTDFTGFDYTFLTYLLYTIVIMFTITTELDNLVVTRTEAEVFTAMPIDDELLTRGKMYMLQRYIYLLVVPLFFPGACFYFTIMKSVPRSIMYFIGGYALISFIIYFILFLYSASLKVFKAKRLGSYTLVFQLAMVMIMLISYQMLSFSITGRQNFSAMNYLNLLEKKGIIDIFPQAWYAFLSARSHYQLDWTLILKFILPFFVTIMSYFSLRSYMMANLQVIREKNLYSSYAESGTGSGISLVRRLTGNFIEKMYLRNHLERASYLLMESMFRQEKAVKLNIIPMIVIPTGLTFFALMTNQLPSPFHAVYFHPVFHVSIMLSVLVVLNTAMLGTKVTNYPGASWIYEAYPVESRMKFKNGIRKFYAIYLVIPVCVLIGLLALISMPPLDAFLMSFFIFLAANLYNSLYNLISRVFPFTKENSLLNSVQKLTYMIFPIGFGVLMVLVQLQAYKSLDLTIIALLSMIAINFLLNFFGFVHVRQMRT